MNKIICEYNGCYSEAKVMNDSKPYCISHYKEEKLREKDKV
jgi:hypothetical protein